MSDLVLDKGAITDGAGSTAHDLSEFMGTGANFFKVGLNTYNFAFATLDGDGYLFVDVNRDGNFSVANDSLIELIGVTSTTGLSDNIVIG